MHQLETQVCSALIMSCIEYLGARQLISACLLVVDYKLYSQLY